MGEEHRPVGELLRTWRVRRRLSQLSLSSRSGVSTRHLSFVETGRSRPSRALLLHVSDQLDVPLRDRNVLLVAGGFAPEYRSAHWSDPELDAVRATLRTVLDAHAASPAIVVDGQWNVVESNAAVATLLRDVDSSLLDPPVNSLRIALHPLGLAPRITNLGEWRAHLLERLARQVESTADESLKLLLDEVRQYPGGEVEPTQSLGATVPLRLLVDGVELSFLLMIASFGTPRDITVAELAIEAFYPADPVTERILREAAELRE